MSKPWTHEEEDDIMIAMGKGLSMDLIAKNHKRTPKAIKIRINLILWRTVRNIMVIEKIKNRKGYDKVIMDGGKFDCMKDFAKMLNMEEFIDENKIELDKMFRGMK